MVINFPTSYYTDNIDLNSLLNEPKSGWYSTNQTWPLHCQDNGKGLKM